MDSGVIWADGLPAAGAAGGESEDWAMRGETMTVSRRMANCFMGIGSIVR
jgi:hypothetical protein